MNQKNLVWNFWPLLSPNGVAYLSANFLCTSGFSSSLAYSKSTIRATNAEKFIKIGALVDQLENFERASCLFAQGKHMHFSENSTFFSGKFPPKFSISLSSTNIVIFGWNLGYQMRRFYYLSSDRARYSFHLFFLESRGRELFKLQDVFFQDLQSRLRQFKCQLSKCWQNLLSLCRIYPF